VIATFSQHARDALPILCRRLSSLDVFDFFATEKIFINGMRRIKDEIGF